MYRKIVLLAFVWMLLVSATSGTRIAVPASASGHQVYSDQSIQEAINNASDGDTIFVSSGVYYEHVVVNKTVSLIGENRITTIIDGSGTGTVIKVTADNVNVTGFTIRNGGGVPYSGIFAGNSAGNTISNNIIRKNFYGLELYASNSNKIVDNDIIDNSYAMYIHGSNSSIFGNTIAYNGFGVWIASSTIFNTFYHNNFLSNNTNQVYAGPGAYWDNGTEGNYWSDYTGEDDGSDGRVKGDGIGDTEIPHLGIDNYPLMSPWGDIAFPVADAGPDQTVYEGVTVTFDGSGSTDDMGIKSYVWNFTDVTPKTLTGVRPTYRFKNVGNFTVTLNVTDYDGKCDTDTMWVNVSADDTKPSIGTVSQDPEVPDDGEKVTILVNVTDEESRVRNVTLWYSANEGATWTDVPMNKTNGNTYKGEIPGFPAGTEVQYNITAYDNAENPAVKPEAGQYYIYTVIPELPAVVVLPLFIIVTLVAAVLRKRKGMSES